MLIEIGDNVRRTILFLIVIVSISTTSTNQAFGHPDTSPPTLNSESAIVIESNTGKVLYEKDPDTQMYPASLTKIATAIYALEQSNIDETVKVSQKASNTGGSSVYLEKEEQVTIKKLIQGLLINSGNDAGVAIAEHMSGSMDQFSSDINNYLTNKIGVQNTHFENSHGLFDSDHVTTAADMAKITQYAMKNKLFSEIFGTKELEWEGQSWDTTLFTHHKLMRERPYEGITGGKTGFVNESGFTLATTAEREDLGLIVITMKSTSSSDAYNDTMNLLDYAFDNFQTTSISEGTIFMLGEQEYKTGKKSYYTHSQDDKVSQKITDNGTLEIINQDDIVIASFSLENIKKETSMMNPSYKIIKEEQKNEKTNKPFEIHFITIAIGSLLIVFISIIFIFQTTKTFLSR